MPTEINLELMRILTLRDGERLALTCKTMFGIAQEAFKEQNYQLRKIYHTVNLFRSDTAAHTPTSVTGLLRQIALNPQIRIYIVHLDPYEHPTSSFDEMGETTTFEAIERGWNALKRLILESEYVAKVDNQPNFARQLFKTIRNEHPDEYFSGASLVFLLTLLPNLESLRITNGWVQSTVAPDPVHEPHILLHPEQIQFQRGIQDLVKLLINRATDETLKYTPLSKLRLLEPMMRLDAFSGGPLVALAPLLSLKSLRKAYVLHGYSEARRNLARATQEEVISTELISSTYPILGPKLEYLHLEGCILDVQTCQAFFCNMNCLRTLQFEYQPEGFYGWLEDLDGFLQSLAVTVGSTLETLILSTRFFPNDNPLIRSPMHGFKALRHIVADTMFLSDRDPIDMDGYDSPIEPIDKPNEKYSLVRLLPQQLESFRLVLPVDYFFTVQQLFDGFETQRGELLPRLTKVEIEVKSLDEGLPYTGIAKTAIRGLALSQGFDLIEEE